MSNEVPKAVLDEIPSMDGFLASLRTIVSFEPAEITPKGNQVRILARLPKVNGKRWLNILRALKLTERNKSWTLDASKMYFLLGDDDDADIVYGWRLIVRADDLPQAFVDMKNVVKTQTTRKRSVQIMEVPLPGALASRNQGKRGGGVRNTMGSRESAPALEFFRR